jgi:hypothetical protein
MGRNSDWEWEERQTGNEEEHQTKLKSAEKGDKVRLETEIQTKRQSYWEWEANTAWGWQENQTEANLDWKGKSDRG